MKEWETTVKYIEDIQDRRKMRKVQFTDDIFKAVDSSIAVDLVNN